MVLITAHPGQHQQEPDLKLCWYQIHKLLGEWLQLQSDPVVKWVVENFQTLLEMRGLGPMNMLERKAIENYFLVTDLNENMEKMMRAVSGRDWPDSAERNVKEEWGRLGFQVRGESDGTGWDPGLFVGVVLDSSEYGMDPWTATAARTGLSFSVSPMNCIRRQHFPHTSSL